MKPRFIEVHTNKSGREAEKCVGVIKSLRSRKIDLKDCYFSIRYREGVFEKFERFSKDVKKLEFDERFRFVSGIEIIGDTRLDEITYHLTKKDFSGKRRKLRDCVMEALYFQAGLARRCLNLSNYTWSDSLNQTNSHLGNFVVFQKSGKIEVGICDLGGLKYGGSFKNETEFQGFSEQEVMALWNDLEENVTISLPSQKKYRFFSNELKKRCFNALVTGYNSFLDEENKRNGIIPKNKYCPIIPKKDFLFLSREEFNELLNYLE